MAAQPKQDVRAVENPISAVIDLGDEVSAQLPEFRRMTIYALVFIGFFLALLVILVLIGLALLGRDGGAGLFIASLAFLIIGVLAFRKLSRARQFFRYYEARHKAIRAVRDEEKVKIPAGADPETRLLAYLTSREKGLAEAARNNVVKRNASQPGKSRSHQFELSAVQAAGLFHDLFKMGAPGCAIFVRTTTHYPTMKEIMDFEFSVKDVCEKTGVPPTRVVWLVHSATGPLSEDVYEYVVKKVIEVQQGILFKEAHACSLQIVTEFSDGTYDFIPFVAGSA